MILLNSTMTNTFRIIIFILFIKFGMSKFSPENGRDFKMYPPCVEINLYCSRSENLKIVYSRDFESCLNLCHQTQNCKWISFYFKGSYECYLHDSCVWPERYKGYAIALANCPASKAEHLGCFEYNVNYRGQAIGVHVVEDHISCQLLCLESRECEVWTYHEFTQRCQFKTSNSLKYREGHWNYISGPKNCKGDHLCFFNFQYYSARRTKIIYKVRSTEACRKQCYEDDESLCIAFSFYHWYDRTGKGVCYLFMRYRNPIYKMSLYYSNGYRSGLKFCDYNFQMSDFNPQCRDYYATLEGDRNKHQLDYKRDLMTRTCEEHCNIWNMANRSQGSCAFYEHDFTATHCWLFKAGENLNASFSTSTVIGRVGDDCKMSVISRSSPSRKSTSLVPMVSNNTNQKLALNLLMAITCFLSAVLKNKTL